MRLDHHIAVVVRSVVDEGDGHERQDEGGHGCLQIDLAASEIYDQLHEGDEDEQERAGEQHEARRLDQEEAPCAQWQPERLEGDREVLPCRRGLDTIEGERAEHEDHEQHAVPTGRALLQQPYPPRPQVDRGDAALWVPLGLNGAETPHDPEQDREGLAVFEPLVAPEKDHAREGHGGVEQGQAANQPRPVGHPGGELEAREQDVGDDRGPDTCAHYLVGSSPAQRG